MVWPRDAKKSWQRPMCTCQQPCLAPATLGKRRAVGMAHQEPASDGVAARVLGSAWLRLLHATVCR
jgi:hypothetical protein